jgi:hypothetical protein
MGAVSSVGRSIGRAFISAPVIPPSAAVALQHGDARNAAAKIPKPVATVAKEVAAPVARAATAPAAAAISAAKDVAPAVMGAPQQIKKKARAAAAGITGTRRALLASDAETTTRTLLG